MDSEARLGDLSDLLTAVWTIQKLSPDTSSAVRFRACLAGMNDADLREFCRAIDNASIARGVLARQLVEVRK